DQDPEQLERGAGQDPRPVEPEALCPPGPGRDEDDAEEGVVAQGDRRLETGDHPGQAVAADGGRREGDQGHAEVLDQGRGAELAPVGQRGGAVSTAGSDRLMGRSSRLSAGWWRRYYARPGGTTMFWQALGTPGGGPREFALYSPLPADVLGGHSRSLTRSQD